MSERSREPEECGVYLIEEVFLERKEVWKGGKGYVIGSSGLPPMCFMFRGVVAMPINNNSNITEALYSPEGSMRGTMTAMLGKTVACCPIGP